MASSKNIPSTSELPKKEKIPVTKKSPSSSPTPSSPSPSPSPKKKKSTASLHRTAVISQNFITVGIDEAGRGPILGPLVTAALAFTPDQIKQLEWLGVKDSKKLSRDTRDELFERIREVTHDFRIEFIEPDAIDSTLRDPATNLNWLEADTQARLTCELDPDIVIIDCPSPNIPAYTEYFKKRLSTGVKKKVKIIMEHKADANHLPVAAASIVAKVLRDKAMDSICNDIGKDVGSGYPSDPVTKKFIAEHYQDYPEIFRKSWSTYKALEEKKKQKTLGEF